MSTLSRATRRATAAAVVTCGAAACAALLSACGSGTSPSGASASLTPGGPASSVSSSSPTSHGPASPASDSAKTQCATTALTATVDAGQGGAAAGSSYLPINFTNVSSHSCVLYGFPGVSWVTGIRGSQIGSAATRERSYSPVTVTLAPGAIAHAVVQIADAGNFPAATCKPVTAHWLRVYPPDQFTSLYAKFTTQVCSKKISGSSFPLGIMPIRSGRGTTGQAP